MENEKKKSAWPLMIGLFAAAMGVTFLVYWLMSGMGLGLTQANAKRVVSGSSAIQASELQDGNGRFVILDYPEYDVSAYVTLGDYKNMAIDPIVVPEISDERLQSNIEGYISYYERYEVVVEGTVHEGDIVDIAYEAFLDGKRMEAYSSDGNVIKLGSSGEPEGFVEQVDGTAIGEDLEFTVPFAEDWSDPAVAGKELTFRVHVSQVNAIPELNDDTVGFITDGEYDSADAFREHIRGNIEAHDREDYESQVASAAVAKLQEEARFGTVPRELILWDVSLQISYYQEYADQYGMTVEEYMIEAGIAENLDDVLYAMTQAALEEIPRYAVLNALAEAEGITVDPVADSEAIAEREQQLIDGLGLSGRDKLLEYYHESNVYNDVRNWSVIDWLTENVRQAEPAAEPAG